MFLAQSFKKVLKENFQKTKNAKNDDDLFQRMKDIERGCGLDPNNTATSPAFYELEGNIWHSALSND